jgi:hypothetical protein
MFAAAEAKVGINAEAMRARAALVTRVIGFFSCCERVDLSFARRIEGSVE